MATNKKDRAFNHLASSETFRYRLLSRMRSDCIYFLGDGNRCEKYLWGSTISNHIKIMKELWNSFPDTGKPEWLTMEQIEEFESQMT